MDAIQWKGNTLYLLDQTKLPVEEVWLSYTDYRPVIDAIRTMVVRGAPAIGVTAAYAYCLAALEGADLKQAKEALAASRPTAVNLFWALDRMTLALSAGGGGSNLNACGNNKRPSDIRRAGVLYACYPKLHDDDIHRLELFFEGFGKTFVGNEDVDILGAGKGIGHDFADFRAV